MMEHACALVQDVYGFMGQEFMTDVTLVAGMSQDNLVTVATTIRAHRLVLASVSGLLRSTLMDDDGDAVIILPDATSHDISSVLSLLYKGSVEFSSKEDLDNMLKLLVALDMTELGNQALECLHKSPTYKRQREMSSSSMIKRRRAKRREANSQEYHCEFCDRVCSKESELISHKRSHTGERPFVCNICGKQFGFKHILTRHLSFHAGKRPHQCSICNVGFTQRSDLEKHFRTHSGERPYSCSVCERDFGRMDYLRKHMNTHTKEDKGNSSDVVEEDGGGEHLEEEQGPMLQLLLLEDSSSNHYYFTDVQMA